MVTNLFNVATIENLGFPVPEKVKGINPRSVFPKQGDPETDNLVLVEIFSTRNSEYFLLSKLTDECAIVPVDELRKARMLVQSQREIPVKLEALKIFPVVPNRNQSTVVSPFKIDH